MPQSSLLEIERALTTLWMRRDARTSFLNGDKECVAIDPQIAEAIDKDGMELYASLLNFGHQDLMVSIFPLCAKLLSKHWEEIVDDYLETYPSDHFNLNRAGKRFPEYLEKHEPKLKKRFPYIVELADYEWIELELLEHDEIAPVSDIDRLQTPEQFASHSPIVNPALALRRYNYSIMKIAQEIESADRKPRNSSRMATNVIVYRDPQGNRSRFLEVGNAAAVIIEKSLTGFVPYTELVAIAISMNPKAEPQSVVCEFLEMVESLQESRVFLGNRAKQAT